VFVFKKFLKIMFQRLLEVTEEIAKTSPCGSRFEPVTSEVQNASANHWTTVFDDGCI
jgi:hypothetical protein